MAFTLNRIGDLHMRLADRGRAREVIGEATEILRDLVEIDPGNTGWQHDLALSLNRTGYLEALAGAEGDRDGGLSARGAGHGPPGGRPPAAQWQHLMA